MNKVISKIMNQTTNTVANRVVNTVANKTVKTNKIKYFFLLFLFCVPGAFAFVSGADRYELSLGADAPFFTGMQARYNFNTQYYAKAGAGFAMELFMNAHQDLLSQTGLSKNSSMLVTALTNSVVFDVRLGWAVNIYEGPYLELGYGLMLWGKGEVKGAMINSALNKSNPLPAGSTYEVDVLNHGPSFHIGYRFILIDKLSFNMDLGVYKPLFAQTKLNYGNESVPSGDSEKVNDLVFKEIWFLSVGLWFGLSF